MNNLFGFFHVNHDRAVRRGVGTSRAVGAIRAMGQLGLAVGLLIGCQATGRPAEDSRISESESGDRSTAKEAPSPIKENSVSASDQRHPVDTPQITPEFQLNLPASKIFVSQLLPPANASRYTKWRETSRLAVNQSHLYLAASLGAGSHFLVTSDDEATVRVYEKDSKKLLGNYSLGQKQFDATPVLPWVPAHGTAIGNEDSFLIGSNQGLRLYDATTGILQKTLSAQWLDTLMWSADGQILMARIRIEGNRGSDLLFLERTGPAELSPLGQLKFAERVDAWDLSRDNRLLAVSYYPSNDVEVFDLHKGTTLTKFSGPNYVASLSFSPDGRALAIGGQGLMLVDVVTPEKRAYYSYFANNINTVRFSPSGDAVATSSYDGRIRLFSYALTPASLTLVQTLKHVGTANVYSIEFSPNGHELMSASGDQTVRRFGAQPQSEMPDSSRATFHSLERWQELLPAEEQQAPPVIAASMKNGHYWPPSLNGPARTSRIKPGKYACRITTMYRLRDCTVTLDAGGHTLLEFASDNLFGLKGVLYDDGSVTRYEAWLTEPSSLYDCEGCEKQPIFGFFRGTGSNFSGLLLLRNVYDDRSAPPQPAGDTKIEEADDRLPLSLQYRGPLTTSSTAHDRVETDAL